MGRVSSFGILWGRPGLSPTLSGMWPSGQEVDSPAPASTPRALILQLLEEAKAVVRATWDAVPGKSLGMSWSVFRGVSTSSVQGKDSLKMTWPPFLSLSIVDSPGDVVSD